MEPNDEQHSQSVVRHMSERADHLGMEREKACKALVHTRKPGRSVAAPSLSSHAANNLDDRIDGLSCIAE